MCLACHAHAVHERQLVLVGVQPQPPPHHLGIQAVGLGRSGDDDRFHQRHIRPLGEYHAVHQTGNLPCREPPDNFAPVGRFSRDDHCPVDPLGDLFRMADAGGEDQRCTLGVFPVRLRHRIFRASHCLVQFPRCIVPVAGVHLPQVIADVDTAAEDVTEIALRNAPPEIPPEHDLVEHVAEPCLVGAVRCRREPDDLMGREVVQHFPVGRRCGVVCLVHDNGVKAFRLEPFQPVDKALHAGRNHLVRGLGGFPCHFHAGAAAGVVPQGLTYQFLPMGQQQHVPVPWQVGKGCRLSQTGRHLHQIPPVRLVFQNVDTFLLIRS